MLSEMHQFQTTLTILNTLQNMNIKTTHDMIITDYQQYQYGTTG